MRSWAYNRFGVLMGASWLASGLRWPSLRVDVVPMITLFPSQGYFCATALIHILKPEDKIVHSEGMTVAPLHTTAQMKGDRPAISADLPVFGDIGAHLRARI